MLNTEILDRIRGLAVNRRDRRLIYATLALSWLTIAAVLIRDRDGELSRIALNGCLWLIAALVFVFVAAGVGTRKVAADAATRKSEPASPVAGGAP